MSIENRPSIEEQNNPEDYFDNSKETEKVPQVDKNTGIYVDPSGQEWVAAKFFRYETDIAQSTIYRLLTNTPKIKGKDKRGVDTDLFNKVAALEKIAEFIALPLVDQETGVYIDEQGKKWAGKANFLKYFSFTALDGYLKEIPSIEGRSRRGQRIKLYDSLLAEEKLRKVSAPQVDETRTYTDSQGKTWVVITPYAKLHGISSPKKQLALEGVPTLKGRGFTGRKSTTFYDEEQVKEKIDEYFKIPQVDKINGEYIDEKSIAWVTEEYLKNRFTIGYPNLRGFLPSLKSINGKDSAGRRTTLYDKEQAIKILTETGYSEIPRYYSVAKTNFSSEIKIISDPNTIQYEHFRDMIACFGGGHVLDILYKLHPRYRSLPIEYVKSVIADYLGDFLITKPPFDIREIEKAVPMLSDPNLREGLVEVMKEDCLSYYNHLKRNGTNLTDEQIFASYIDNVKMRTNKLESEELTQAVDQVAQYYRLLISDLEKPSQLVDNLEEGREFPDVNQLINIKELKDKKRILIADEMGLGKSASVILAKEYLGLKRALVVCPSNVIDTWQNFLSSKEGGYFKADNSPRVLIVTSPESLTDIEIYDYVLISQERMNEQYRELLERFDFDLMVIDEVHKLKNLREGVRASNIVELSQKIQGEQKYLALLSGTPAPNKVEDIAVILKLLYPEKFESIENKDLIRNIIRGDIIDLRNLLVPRMQMKSLTESIEMPRLDEKIVEVELSDREKEVYELLLEEDELTASQKIQVLRQYLLNPELLEPIPTLESSKINALVQELRESFVKHDKVLVFFNGYVENIIRGEKSILGKLGLEENVELLVIEGEVEQARRIEIQRKLKESPGKVLLIVSGQTADVGVDFSAGQKVIFYNEPWTQFEKLQQLHRVYRPGLKDDLESSTIVVKDTIEEGIHTYIQEKQRAILKLLKGVPITDLEQRLLSVDEKEHGPNLEVNPELAKHYLRSWNTMMRIFGYVRGLGETDFVKFISKFGEDYANCYLVQGSRSYQANVARMAGTLLHEMVQERGESIDQLKILDVASGPEVLKRHAGDQYQDKVYSLDINKYHFHEEGGKKVIGSYLNLPLQDKTTDHANLSLAWHYTNFAPGLGRLERIEVIKEINRVLKLGGRLVIALEYTSSLKDQYKFRQAVRVLGFKIVDEYTGKVTSGDQFKSNIITLEKVSDCPQNTSVLVDQIGKENFDGFKFVRKKDKLRNSRRIINDFTLGDKNFDVHFNGEDLATLQEEQTIIQLGEDLKAKYGDIKSIPASEIERNGFSQYTYPSTDKSVLYKRLSNVPGGVIIK